MKIQFKKYQAGGAFAPFLSSYTPVVTNSQYSDPVLQYLASVGSVGTSTGTTTSTKSSSKSSSGDSIDMKDTISLLKDMRGLDNDVSQVTSQLIKNAQYESLFGSGDPTVAYYKNLNLINKVIESKEEYKDAYDQAKSQNALSEAAISSDGKVVVKTGKGYNLVTPEQALKLQQLGKGLIQKNADLLNDRKHNPNMAFQNGVLNIVENSVSFDSISKVINAIAGSLGKSTIQQEGYTTKYGNQIAAGIQALKEAGTGTMNGVYKVTFKNETQEAQAKMAIDAIYRNLNEAQKAYLKLNSNGSVTGAYGLIKEIVMNRTSSNKEILSDYQKNMNSDGSAKSSTTDSNGNPIEKAELDPAMEFALGYGSKSNFAVRGKGQVAFNVNANSIAMLDGEGKPISTTTLDGLGSGRLGGMLDLNHASMDGAMLSPSALSKVVVDGGRVYAADLPIIVQDGIVKPNLQLLKKIEEINQTKLGNLKNIPQDKLTAAQKQQINQIYQHNGVAAKYDSNGNLTSQYRRFMLVNGTSSEKAFVGEPKFDIQAQQADDQSKENYVSNIKNLTKNDKFKLDDGWFSSEKVYQGTIFIPMNNNFVDYQTGSGIKYSNKQAMEIDALQQRRDYLLSKYNNPGNFVQ